MAGRIVAPDTPGLTQAVETLRRGGLVGLPTETVYGLAANGLNPEAVARIFAAKARPHFDPLILHIPPSWKDDFLNRGIVDRERLTPAQADQVAALSLTFWPGPLTLVLPKGSVVPDLVTSGLDTVAIRMPSHPVAAQLLEKFGGPLAAPSANRFGRISPTRPEHVLEELGGELEIILDGGPCSMGVESTVIAATEGGWTLLRPGALAREAIESHLGQTLRTARPGTDAQASPGMLDSHYAPRKALYLLEGEPESWAPLLASAPRAAALFFNVTSRDRALKALSSAAPDATLEPVLVLSPGGTDLEAAQRLFGCLRSLDASSAETLFAELPAGTQGLYPALRDRLTRAGRKKDAP
ncbi:MAG TPA: L-threonylcarbamoyladenylate synthase [Bdellovibrionota bacterium]|nr:L-threonylcarbamoyladenylate synthase [Bdellovibrionota bacterium]